MDQIQQLQRMIDESSRIVFFGGAEFHREQYSGLSEYGWTLPSDVSISS